MLRSAIVVLWLCQLLSSVDSCEAYISPTTTRRPKTPRIQQAVTATAMSLTNDNNPNNNDTKNVVLVVGSCGLDKILTVPSYPSADAKIRSTSYCEVGGGNGSNSAHTMALLTRPVTRDDHKHPPHPLGVPASQLHIQLATKVGDDAVGTTVQQELLGAGVDLSSPLFQIATDATTAFTTILVATDDPDPSRTCIHTPGSCGELVLAEVQRHRLDDNVGHLHLDARHTDVALCLAQQAKQRRIPVSLDVEKDRQTRSLDQLLPLADLVFTNAQQIESYLCRLDQELQQERRCRLVSATPVLCVEKDNPDNAIQPDLWAHCLKPSMYFTRWYQQVGKQVIITKGNKGSVHVCCNEIQQESVNGADDKPMQNHISFSHLSNGAVQAVHTYQMVQEEETLEPTFSRVTATYTMTTTGVSRDLDAIVDTTGAGDAFLGAFLVAQRVWEDTATRLAFAAWVAGRKLSGSGARLGLPDSLAVQERLGSNPLQIQQRLREVVNPNFGN